MKGLVVHGAGWPLSENGGSGGFFLYHAENNQVSVGLITDLNYSNPHLSPFDEFQRFKHHPQISKYLEGGTRVSYGARAIAKGGLNSLSKMTAPGAMLLGCDAGTLNFAKIKGTHTAMKSGMVAAETLIDAFAENMESSWSGSHLNTSKTSKTPGPTMNSTEAATSAPLCTSGAHGLAVPSTLSSRIFLLASYRSPCKTARLTTIN